tara:strand:- start:1224 stop:2282 length:1059 start_codon:yes stop_codon:yes gene_type:complete
MALNSFSEQTYTRVPVKREPKKTGRRYGSAGLTYPIDMGIDAPAELDNHIIFDIYFDETTSFTNIQGTRDEPKAWKGHSAIVGNKATKAIENLEQGVKNLAGVGEGGLADKALNAIPEGVTSSVGKFKNGAFGGAQNLKKLNASIALAVPNTFTATSSANYTEAKLGAVAGLLSRIGAGEQGQKDIANLGGQAARLAMETFAALPDAFGMNLQNIMEVSTRRVSNPHIEQRFESVSFREFQFVYEFAARSEQEMRAIDNIIKTFRFHMHPELIPSGLFFDYPSMFDITVMHKNNENKYMHRISTCYLTSFTTNYTSTGVFATNRDGQPTEIQCTMNFREIEPLHKHRIEEGY